MEDLVQVINQAEGFGALLIIPRPEPALETPPHAFECRSFKFSRWWKKSGGG